MRLVLVWTLLASGCFSDGTGTVVYSDATTGHVMTVDVATGAQATLDLGFFGDVSIAPDRQHVAYLGQDLVPRVTDLHGNATPLLATNGCNSPFAWGPRSTLSYCLGTMLGVNQTAFLPAIGAPVRTLVATSVATSHDGSRIAYMELTDPSGTANGNVVVEDADGGHRQVLRSNVEIVNLAFLPDDSGLVTVDVVVGAAINLHLATIAFADGAHTDLGPGTLPPTVPNGTLFSPDGREVLAFTGGMLAAVDLGSGAARSFATVDPNVSQVAAAFVARDKVIYSRVDNFFMGDVGGPGQSSVRIADGTAEKILVSSDGSSQCSIATVAVDRGLAALVCAVPAIIDFDGSIVASRNGTIALGISGDGDGLVSVNKLGQIEYASRDGNVKLLATALVSDGTTPLTPPFAAYAP